MTDKRVYDTEQYDPNWYFPDEFIEMEAIELPAEEEADADYLDDILEGDETSNQVPVPEEFSIVSQVIRMKKNGDYVIDVVVRVGNDVNDSVKYDVRITPAS